MKSTILRVTASTLIFGCGGVASEQDVPAQSSLSAPCATAEASDMGIDGLKPGDGWASLDAGTTGGGALASAAQAYVVASRAQLIAALNDGVLSSTSPSMPSSAAKIIYVSGTIDFNVDDAGQPLTCPDYYRDGYTLEAFLLAYEPVVWGPLAPSGTLESARVASQLAQQARVRIRIGSNTTLVGLGQTARLRGAWLDLRGTSSKNLSNVIIRNLTLEDTFDCFPAWSPTDGAHGAWNALYDSISLRNTDHVWIDHNTFRDHDTADESQPNYFGVLYQVHDGELDITNASDLVTVSYNRFLEHDKVMLIGSSDSATADTGKLRVTLHHNWFDGANQRAPRVRFGKVDVFDNYYEIERNPAYVYSWGVGIASGIIAANNYFKTDHSVTPDRFITRFSGTAINETGTLLNGTPAPHPIDVVAAWNAVNDPDLSEDVGWEPSLRLELDPTSAVPGKVQRQSGPRRW